MNGRRALLFAALSLASWECSRNSSSQPAANNPAATPTAGRVSRVQRTCTMPRTPTAHGVHLTTITALESSDRMHVREGYEQREPVLRELHPTPEERSEIRRLAQTLVGVSPVRLAPGRVPTCTLTVSINGALFRHASFPESPLASVRALDELFTRLENSSVAH